MLLIKLYQVKEVEVLVMKQTTKEKLKKFFNEAKSFENRVSVFFVICFLLLTIHTFHMTLIMDEIKSLELNVMSWSDYSYSAYNSTEEIKELVSMNPSAITHYEYENHGTYTIVRIMPKNITDETVVSIMDGEEFLKAERENEYFSVEVSGEPEFVIVKTENKEGIHTDKIYLTDKN